jgi:hypothetical protein
VGTLISVLIVFAILVVATRSLGFLRRGRLSVADEDVTVGAEVRRAAAIGAGSGLLVLLLLAVLYVGIARWNWLGHPTVNHSAVASPIPLSSPGSAVGAGVSSSPPAGSAAASPSASASP